MKVFVINAYSGSQRVFEGTLDEVKAALVRRYPWSTRFGDDFEDILNEVARAQALFVELLDPDDDISPKVTSKNTRR